MLTRSSGKLLVYFAIGFSVVIAAIVLWPFAKRPRSAEVPPKAIAPMLAGHPRLNVAHELHIKPNVTIPEIPAEERREILQILGRVPSGDYTLTSLESAWDGNTVALRATVGSTLVFLTKDAAEKWSAVRIIRIYE